MGIEPIWSAWKAENLPLIYIREGFQKVERGEVFLHIERLSF